MYNYIPQSYGAQNLFQLENVERMVAKILNASSANIRAYVVLMSLAIMRESIIANDYESAVVSAF